MSLPFNESLFWAKVNKTPKCWLWTASVDDHGYGRFTMDQKARKAHRASWLLHFGPIPHGLWVLHSCDNPPCVNPDHLWLGTNTDNLRDAIAKGRMATGDRNGTRTHPEANGGAKLTKEEVMGIRKRFERGEFSYAEVGREFHVIGWTISKVVNRRTWIHV